ncbi:hypothetical protein ACOME3_001739 [Neoechinorhynchus agilis]
MFAFLFTIWALVVSICSQNQSLLTHCPFENDGYLNWPQMRLGYTFEQKCPHGWYGVDSNRNVTRKCLPDGRWGKSTYIDCLSDAIKSEYDSVYRNVSVQKRKVIFVVIKYTRICEMICLCTSSLSIVLALFVFRYIDKNRTLKTKIHFNFFSALLLQMIARIINYTIQLCFQNSDEGMRLPRGLRGICEFNVIFLQYCVTSTFISKSKIFLAL